MDTMIMKMPAVALRGMVILPGMVAHFDVSRAKSIKAVEEAMMDEQKIFLVAQKDVEQENPDIEDLFKIGIIAEVKQVIKLQNNIVRILVEGKERAELSAFLENPDYLLAEIIRFDEEVDDGLPEEAKEAMLRSIQETFGKYVVVNPKMGKELQRQLSEITDLEKLMNQLANSLPVHFEEKQKILDAVSMTERYEVLMALLLKEIEIIAIKNDFQAKVKAHVDKNQKDYLLREQMQVIREELGESNTETDAQEYEKAVAAQQWMQQNVSPNGTSVLAQKALEQGKANYKGFCEAYQLIMKHYGISAKVVNGKKHMENSVVIAGKKYTASTLETSANADKTYTTTTIPGLAVNRVTMVLSKGRTGTFKVTGQSKGITWSSSNTKVAVVNASGKVTAKGTGTAKVTLKVNGKTFACTVCVNP